jgi:SAM-dependent methyltransferase
MDEMVTNVYERLWNPKAYLQQYYSTADVSGDDQALFEFVITWLQHSGRTFGTGIEVGCGPTVHHVAPFASYVKEIHLADYLPINLDEVRDWLAAKPNAHDWNVYFRGALALEGNNEPSALLERKNALRRQITALKTADVRLNHPLNDNSTYDLVMSFYCIEAVATSRDEWRQYLGNLCRLVAPGGVLFLAALRQSQAYHVLDEVFSTACINEEDFADALPQFGFPSTKMEIRAVAIPDWSEQGFDGICCVRGEKSLERSDSL